MTMTMLHVRVDEQTKEQASAALEAMGLSISGKLCACSSAGWRLSSKRFAFCR